MQRAEDQKRLDRLKDGKQCLKLRGGRIRSAQHHYIRTKKSWMALKKQITLALSAKVVISSQVLSSITPGKCSWVFTSTAYLSARTRYNLAIRREYIWRGHVKEAKKMVERETRSAGNRVHKCRCHTKKKRDRVWKELTQPKLIEEQSKAHAKCIMMQCVLKGLKFSDPRCKSRLKTLVNKTLTKATENVKNCSGKPEPEKPGPKPVKPLKPIKQPVICPTGNPNCMCPGTRKQCPKKNTPYKIGSTTCYRISCECSKCPKKPAPTPTKPIVKPEKPKPKPDEKEKKAKAEKKAKEAKKKKAEKEKKAKAEKKAKEAKKKKGEKEKKAKTEKKAKEAKAKKGEKEKKAKAEKKAKEA